MPAGSLTAAAAGRRKHLLSVLLLSLLAAVAAAATHGPSPLNEQQQHPHWLLGLADLQHHQQQPLEAADQPTLTATVLSGDGSKHHHGQHHGHHQGQGQAGKLLRPQSLPPLSALTGSLAQLESLSPQQQGVGVGPAPLAPPSLAKVAERYALPQSQLQQMMQQDSGLLVSNEGLLVWSCVGQHSDDNTRAATSSSSSDSDAAPVVLAAVQAQQAHAGTWADGDSSDVNGGSTEDDTGSLFTIILPPGTATPEATVPDSQPAVDVLASLHSMPLPQAHTAAAQLQPGPQPPPEDAFRLHSRPPGSVQHTIFLDFRGCSITGSYWNTATKKPVLQTQPFDLDSDPTTLSVQEQQAVVAVWQAVAQDFAAWAVDVTTEPQPLDALVRSTEDDTVYGMHVCVGGSSATTVGGLSGGLAFTGAYGQLGPALQPVLVFPEQLGNGHPRAVADSISHEVGHTFGLAHFGGSGSAPYNDGAGPWGPLLGLPYGRVLSQWSKRTAVTGQLQDDLQLISQQLPLLADDHGNTPGTATQLCDGGGSSGHSPLAQGGVAQRKGVCKRVRHTAAPEQGSGLEAGPEAAAETGLARAAVRGLISNSSDQDWFTLDVGRAGPVHVKLQLPSAAAGYGVNNLLAAVRVFAADGQQLAVAQPQASGSEVSMQVSTAAAGPGTLYISVEPVGVAGVSSYGSLGDYLLSVTFPSSQPVVMAKAGQAAAVNQPHAALASSSIVACAAHKGLVPKPVVAGAVGGSRSASSSSTALSCQYPEVRALSFSAKSCSTAAAGAVVLLNFTISSPPACFEGSIIAAAPQLEPLAAAGGGASEACPCRQSPRRPAHRLPLAAQGVSGAVPADGSYTCQQGVYSYGWQLPHVSAGCHRLRVTLADGSNVLAVLRVVAVSASADAVV